MLTQQGFCFEYIHVRNEKGYIHEMHRELSISLSKNREREQNLFNNFSTLIQITLAYITERFIKIYNFAKIEYNEKGSINSKSTHTHTNKPTNQPYTWKSTSIKKYVCAPSYHQVSLHTLTTVSMVDSPFFC